MFEICDTTVAVLSFGYKERLKGFGGWGLRSGTTVWALGLRVREHEGRKMEPKIGSSCPKGPCTGIVYTYSP